MAADRETLRVEVENLHCEGCAATLREALGDLPGLELAKVDVERRSLRIELDPELTGREEVREELRKAGFPATDVARIEESEGAEPSPARRAAPYALLALALLLLGGAGYAGYELYPRFDLPSAEGVTLLFLAAGAGIASFFSPCAFGLLVTLLAREAGEKEGRPGRGRPLRFATGMSLGASLFVLAVGAVIALGGSGLVSGVTFTSAAGRALRLGVGVFLVLLGLIQLGLLPNPLHRVEEWVKPLQRLTARERRQRPFWGYTLFGFGYLLAGFG